MTFLAILLLMSRRIVRKRDPTAALRGRLALVRCPPEICWTSGDDGGLEFGGVEAGPRAKRRSWAMAERQRIVRAALASGASVASVARANGVNANLVFKWVRRSLEGWRGRRRTHCGGRPGLTRRRRSCPFALLRRSQGAEGCGHREGWRTSRQCDPPRPARLGAREICVSDDPMSVQPR